MKGQFINKKVLLLLGVIFIVLGITIGLLLRSSNNSSSSVEDKSYEYTDPQTGEQVSVQPGVTPETYNSDEGEATLIGLSTLANFGSVSLSSSQLPTFRQDLLANAIKKLNNPDSVVKVVNPEMNLDTLFLEADLIYREGTKPARLEFDIESQSTFSYKVIVDKKTAYQSPTLYSVNNGDIPSEPN